MSVLDKFPLRICIHSSDAQGAITELVEYYSDSIGLSTEIRNGIKRKVMAREDLGASMLDNGVVIPLARDKRASSFCYCSRIPNEAYCI